MKQLLSEFTKNIDKVTSTDELFRLMDQVIQKNLQDAYAVCLKIDKESFEFLPIRSVDKALIKNIESYMDEGIFADALMAGKPFYVFDTRKYNLKEDESLVLFPLIFSGDSYGVIAVVTKPDTCRKLLNEYQEDILEFSSILSKMVELFRALEETKEGDPAGDGVSSDAHNIIESVVHGIVVINKEGVIDFFNKNAEMIFGFSSHDVLKKVYRDVFPERLTRTFDLLTQNTLIEGHILDFEIEWELSPQVKIPVGISTSLITDSEGVQKGIVFICRDMSLTKEVNRLKDLDKLKSEFVSMVSHELKNPIAVIKSSVETLMAAKKMGKDLGPDFEVSSMKTINEEIDRLSELISDLLSLSRIESGKVELKHAMTNVEELLVSVVNLFQVSSKTHPVKLECELKEPVPMDVEKIKQVVINFINNAIKYSPNGSDILVKAVQSDIRLTVSVTDHGLGIPEEAVKKVFEKFYRVATKETSKIGGTGLGLAICQKIIELHGGKIWVKSKLGEGSTFGFDLPLTAFKKEFVEKGSAE